VQVINIHLKVGGNMLKKPVMQKEKKTKKILAQS
jgi:hypothetical protein